MVKKFPSDPEASVHDDVENLIQEVPIGYFHILLTSYVHVFFRSLLISKNLFPEVLKSIQNS